MVEVVIALEPYERGGALSNGTDSTSARNRGSATPLLNSNSDRLAQTCFLKLIVRYFLSYCNFVNVDLVQLFGFMIKLWFADPWREGLQVWKITWNTHVIMLFKTRKLLVFTENHSYFIKKYNSSCSKGVVETYKWYDRIQFMLGGPVPRKAPTVH